jgi:hypothetical protein
MEVHGKGLVVHLNYALAGGFASFHLGLPAAMKRSATSSAISDGIVIAVLVSLLYRRQYDLSTHQTG